MPTQRCEFISYQHMHHAMDTHTEETKRKHWEDVQELLNKTCNRHLIIWGADASGKLGNRNREEEEEEKYAKKEHDDRRIIGHIRKPTRQKRKWGKTTQNIPKRTNDTDGNMEKPQDITNG